MKRVTKDVEIRGYHVPRDSLLQTLYFSMNYSESQFEQPDAFSPERFLQRDATNGARTPESQFAPFGIGTLLVRSMPY